MNLLIEILSTVIVLSIAFPVITYSQQDSVISPCHETETDKSFTVDCSGLALQEIYAEWFPNETTILILDNNKLMKVPNNTFGHLTHLYYLSMSNNVISSIEKDAFVGLQDLAALNLSSNRLQYSNESFPADVFTPLENLTELRLWQSYQMANEYPERFLGGLEKLSILAIDTVGITLTFGEQFAKLTKLSRLELTGNVKTVTDTSFENVTQVKELIMYNMHSMNGNVSSDILKPLINLDLLHMNSVTIGVANTLRILKPFANRSMSGVSLNEVGYSAQKTGPTLENGDGILDGNKTKYLSEICVRHFALIESNIFIIKKEVFPFDSNLYRCLESIDLSKNPFAGERLELFRILRMNNLKTIIFENAIRPSHRKRPFSDSVQFPVEDFLTDKIPKTTSLLTSEFQQKREKYGISNLGAKNLDKESKAKEILPALYSGFPKIQSLQGVHGDVWKENRTGLNVAAVGSSKLNFYVGKSLRTIKAKALIYHMAFSDNVNIVGAYNLTYFDSSDNGLYDFRGLITGVSVLQTFLLSGNDVSLISESFFDSLENLRGLAMADCLMNADFMAQYSSRLFQKIQFLQKLDISSNSLPLLAPGTFSTNNDIEELNLAGNRFQSVPFELKYTPKLRLLDLRGNAIASLDEDITNVFDYLASKPQGFRLLLSENILSCDCQNIPFLKWLIMTPVHLDNNGNYSCIDSSGKLSYTRAPEYEDLVALWLLCNGQFFFFLSISLLLVMFIGFLSFILMWKRKMLIKSILLQFVFGLKLKKARDYNFGVFIGYSSDEYIFPVRVLKPFIENRLNLSTYLEHMDPVPGTIQVSNVYNAIQNSWRILLVLTESFLDPNGQSIITIMSAIFSLSPANPGRIVVMVHRNLVNQLPPELLSSIPEDNIIILNDWVMTYEVKQTLRTRMLSV